jgi:cytochrome c biogenesis protein CcmG/thiol:disulfide interchange protein DsbE
MKKFVIPGLVVAAAVALIALLTYGVSSHSDTASIDAKVARGDYPMAPDYRTALPLLGTDRRVDLASFRGKVVVLNMFASWCVPCHSEAPLIAREERILARHGATLVSVSYRDSSSSTQSFERKYGLHAPVLRDVSGDFAHAFGTYQVPETFVISPRGRIEALRRYEVGQRWFTRTVLPLLKQRS